MARTTRSAKPPAKDGTNEDKEEYKLLENHELSRLANETLMSAKVYFASTSCIYVKTHLFQEISGWVISVGAVLVEWKKSCIDDPSIRSSILDYIGENRQAWDKKARNIAARCTPKMADSDIYSLDAIDRCAHTACMVVMHGTVNAYFADSSRDDAWRNKCAVRLLLAIVADFLDDAYGNFVELLGAPQPTMHRVSASTSHPKTEKTSGRVNKLPSMQSTVVDDEEEDEEVVVPQKKRRISKRKSSTVVPQPQQTAHSEDDYDDGWDSEHVPASGPIPERYQRRNPVEPTIEEELHESRNALRREREDRRIERTRLEGLANKWKERAEEVTDRTFKLVNKSVKGEVLRFGREKSQLRKKVEKEVERYESANALAASETARADEEAAARMEAEAKLGKVENELAKLKMADKHFAP